MTRVMIRVRVRVMVGVMARAMVRVRAMVMVRVGVRDGARSYLQPEVPISLAPERPTWFSSLRSPRRRI